MVVLLAFSAASPICSPSLHSHRPATLRKRYGSLFPISSSLSSSPNSPSTESTDVGSFPHERPPSPKPFIDHAKPADTGFKYSLADASTNTLFRIARSTESTIERV